MSAVQITLPEGCRAKVVSANRQTSLALPYREEAKVQDKAAALEWMEGKIAGAEDGHPIKSIKPEDVKIRYSFNEEGLDTEADFDALEPRLVGEKLFIELWVPEDFLPEEVDAMISTDKGERKANRKHLLKVTAESAANRPLRKAVTFFDTSAFMVS